MGGIGGIAAYSHAMKEGVERERARRWMADEANARSECAAYGTAMPTIVRIVPCAVPRPGQS